MVEQVMMGQWSRAYRMPPNATMPTTSTMKISKNDEMAGRTSPTNESMRYRWNFVMAPLYTLLITLYTVMIVFDRGARRL